MGTIKQGILGGFNGKVGTVVGASWKGISYMRGIAQSVRNPKTEAQVKQRNFFIEISGLVSQFTEDQLKTFFPKSVRGKTRRNLLFQQLAEACTVTDDAKHFDASLLSTIGNASTINFGEVNIMTLVGIDPVTMAQSLNALSVMFDGDKSAEAFNNYGAFIVINATKGTIHCFNSTLKMNADAHEIPAQPGWEKNDSFVVIPFIYKSAIAIHGFGTMGIAERPPRK